MLRSAGRQGQSNFAGGYENAGNNGDNNDNDRRRSNETDRNGNRIFHEHILEGYRRFEGGRNEERYGQVNQLQSNALTQFNRRSDDTSY